MKESLIENINDTTSERSESLGLLDSSFHKSMIEEDIYAVFINNQNLVTIEQKNVETRHGTSLQMSNSIRTILQGCCPPPNSAW